MELHAIGLMHVMLQPHDLFLGRNGSDFQFGWDRVIHHKRVIAHRFKRRRNTFENSLAVMRHFGGLAVHQALGAVHFAAEDNTETLMSEANPEDGNLAIE